MRECIYRGRAVEGGTLGRRMGWGMKGEREGREGQGKGEYILGLVLSVLSGIHRGSWASTGIRRDYCMLVPV